ncbi:G-type lectin S-receptor-like serine/threonine-protein kinase LECRK1 [Elaeis guineensis]|uniref:G-type lectin S-receptor-like serine/threonine-protein kinase LECRK1 n=1 Tax=Elaeis guineensis var. tenera TaxID=51953 RepID=UPI00094FABA5
MALGVGQQGPAISLDDWIATNTSPWLSQSRMFAFGFFAAAAGSGFAVGAWLVSDKTVIWTANRNDEPIAEGARLKLTRGGLMLLPLRSADIPISYLSGDSTEARYASMNDTGSFVIYNINHEVIWQTFDHPTETIMAGQTLQSDQELVSSFSEANHSTGRFRLKMQIDGNLVMYPVDTYGHRRGCLLGRNTYGGGFTELVLDNSGEMKLTSDYSSMVLLGPYGKQR